MSKRIELFLSFTDDCLRKQRVQKRVIFKRAVYNGTAIEGRIKRVELREGQFVDLEVELTTSSGHKAKYQEGTETWESSDESVVSITKDFPLPDGSGNNTNPLKARATCVDGSNNEAVVVRFGCDGDPDADQERPLVGTMDIAATQGEATVVSIKAGTPQDVPAAP